MGWDLRTASADRERSLERDRRTRQRAREVEAEKRRRRFQGSPSMRSTDSPISVRSGRFSPKLEQTEGPSLPVPPGGVIYCSPPRVNHNLA